MKKHIEALAALAAEWAPDAGNPNFWRPRNLKKVRSAGLEFSGNFSQKMGRGWQISIDANGRANQLKNLKFYDQGGSDGPFRQPVSQWAGRAVLSKSRWQLVFSQNLTTFSTDLADLGYKNYSVGCLAVHFSMPVNTGTARFFVKIDNCWGANYQVLPFRAMPGRSGRFGARFSF